jgi:ABC-type nitrate/sulfonate/bicarbonate transport system permease component
MAGAVGHNPRRASCCVLVPAGAPHIMSGRPLGRGSPPRAAILAEMLRTADPGKRRASSFVAVMPFAPSRPPSE